MARRRIAPIIAVLAMCCLWPGARADGTLMSWSPTSIEGMTKGRWNKAKKRKVPAILDLNRRASSWADCYEVLLGAMARRGNDTLVQGLIDQLADSTSAPLQDTSQLVIWERIASGEILFEGKGYQIEDDLFQVAGRANWILRDIYHKTFGYVKPDSTVEDLAALADNWRAWVEGRPGTPWQSPFETDNRDLPEIRSLAALEALIVALQPSPEKDEYVSTCLRETYNLNMLPEDPNAPGALCNPDRWIYSYLGQLTYVTEVQPPEWWAEWWDRERDGLTWDRTDGRFLAPVR